MTVEILLFYCVLAATLARGVLVQAQLVCPTCSRCGRPQERRHLGERICSCRDR